MAQQELQDHRRRELRRPAETTVAPVISAREECFGLLELGCRQGRAGPDRGRRAQRLDDP